MNDSAEMTTLERNQLETANSTIIHTVAPANNIGAMEGNAGNNVLTGSGAFDVTVSWHTRKINSRACAI
jgi:hypothetical protein